MGVEEDKENVTVTIRGGFPRQSRRKGDLKGGAAAN